MSIKKMSIKILIQKSLKYAHPFLMTVYPFVFIVSQNKTQLYLVDIMQPLIISLIIVGIFLVLLKLILKSWLKASFITTILVILFFSYGYIYEAILDWTFFGVAIGRARYLLLLYIGIIFLAFFSISRIKKDLSQVSRFLNIATFILVLLPLINISSGHLSSINNKSKLNQISKNDSQTTYIAQNNNPDIYYIILDAYANADTLKELYDYDNSEFLDYLRDKGFYVVDKARSNFAVTPISLSSSLNMEYVNYLADLEKINGRADMDATNELIANNKAWQYLKNKGYKFVNFKSMGGPTRYIKNADLNIQGGRFDELSMILFQTTMLRALKLHPKLYAYIVNDFSERTLFTFDKLQELSNLDLGGPKFIFAHIMPPHPPFIFGPDGEIIKDMDLQLKPKIGWNEEMKQRYLDQIIFINKKVKEMTDKLLANPDYEPIIIIQSDHGPWSTAAEDHKNNRLYKERMRILNTYYLPGDGKAKLYETITPVNTFRIIFNHYLDANFEILEDVVYFSDSVTVGRKTPYDFIDVTEKVSW